MNRILNITGGSNMKQPAYIKVYNTIKQEIKDGSFKVGDFLPPEPEIEKKFQVSRTTVRRAIEMLSREGYVNVCQGRGTEVIEFSTVQPLNSITSITETLIAKGYTVSTKSIYIDRIPAPSNVANALRIEEGTPVIRIQRVQCADNNPICIMYNYLVEHLAPGIENHKDKITSLYAFLQTKYNVHLGSAIEYISASVSDFMDSQILQVPVGSPLLISKRITSVENNPVEYAIIKILGDKYEYCVYTEGRP